MRDLFRKLKAEPFIMIAGEVHNSNSSTGAAMEPAWVKTDLDRFKRAEVEKGKPETNLKNFH